MEWQTSMPWLPKGRTRLPVWQDPWAHPLPSLRRTRGAGHAAHRQTDMQTISNINAPPVWLAGSVRNTFHSAILIAAMVVLLGAVGGLFGGPPLMVILLGLGVVFFSLGPSLGSQMMLRMQGAMRLTRHEAPRLFDTVRHLAQRAGLSSPPSLYLIPTPAVTAFTTGTRPAAAIALTHGLLHTMTFRELAGVLAHEISHIKRNDVWVMGLANFMTRVTNFMSTLGQILLFLNLPLLLMGQLTMSWTAIMLLVFAPTVAVLLQLALSRTREYQADTGAVRLTGDPLGLASALAKLERLNAGFFGHFRPQGRAPGWTSLLQTHPSTQRRIERLEQLGGEEPDGRAIA